MTKQELIEAYKSKLSKLEQYLELSKSHNSFEACSKIQVEISTIKIFIENLKELK